MVTGRTFGDGGEVDQRVRLRTVAVLRSVTWLQEF